MLDLSTIELRPETPSITVLAGESTSQRISLFNFSSMPDNFDLTMEGLPTSWFNFSSTNLSLFPNWSEAVTLTIEIPVKVRPNQYYGRIVATSRSQAGIRTVFELQIDVLAPLKAEARLQPRRANGFKASYNLIVRNRSQCEGIMTMQLSDANPYCQAQFSPSVVRLGPGRSMIVPLKVQLRHKTPQDQAMQAQDFEIQVQPQWVVNGQLVDTTDLLVEGQYVSKSRWSFIGRHPRIFVALLGFLLLALLIWAFVLPSFNGLVGLVVGQINFPETNPRLIQIEQNALNERVKNNLGGLKSFTTVEIGFDENPQQNVNIKVTNVSPESNLDGRLYIDQNGNIALENKRKTGILWFFVPSEQIMVALNTPFRAERLKKNLKPEKLYVEGNTLYIKLTDCLGGEPACARN